MPPTAGTIRQDRTVPLESTGQKPVDFWPKIALAWALSQYDHVVLLNNNQASLSNVDLPYQGFPNRLAAGVYRPVEFSPDTDPFHTLFRHHRQHPDFLIGYFGYDLKNRIEPLVSRHENTLCFPEIYFFQPLHLIDFDDDQLTVRSWENPDAVIDAILADSTKTSPNTPKNKWSNPVKSRVSPDEYRQTVRQIQQDILDGTVYELNYCIEFFLENTEIDPLTVYSDLTKRSPMPFSHFQRIRNQYVIGASPERFLKKEGNRLISQPIKGTIRRGTTPDEDAQLRQQLRSSEKEQAENLMIVDLVRNDLARSAETGSVRVDELFGIYPFQQLFQMISTVSATILNDLPFTEAIRNAFPMGSMTGAPKVRAMELIDQYEASRRGLYSGAAGFITPDGDFDFNVMIRSIFYNAETGTVSFSVGSAITYDADPQQEYEECLLKAEAMRAVFQE
ncbi:anthranilate synthase component I family protein [Larkinella humicola]|uniref:Anthranilate synthase component I family protein n=1 Tax=Larkinella humicola TaxID=2607654 RepID=A0A5N1JSS5_9BACT|nr:anthranilate synthase component I family protein [Larkinella humicola]KAA9356833.1 anthranilate synthase component I family protein [Larkinella humicola]